MSRYEDAFETLATRGIPAGATALLERIDSEAATPAPLAAQQPTRRWSGPILAAAAFALILGVGLTWNLFLAPGGDIADLPGTDIEWIEVAGDGLLESVTAGPGGFLRVPFFIHPEGPSLEFSSDASTWSDVELEGNIRSAVRQIATTKERWLVVLDDNDDTRAWTSPDGTSWNPVTWPEGMEGTVEQVAGSDAGFAATTSDPFGSGPGYWLSVDGQTWARADQLAPGDPLQAHLRSTGGRLVWRPQEDERRSSGAFFHSADGRTWIEGAIELPPGLSDGPNRWNIAMLEHVNGLWIALGEVNRLGADPVLYSWISRDGTTFEPRGIPEFGSVPDRAVNTNRFSQSVIGEWVVVAPSLVPVIEGPDGIGQAAGASISTGEIWATRDGSAWIRTLRTDGEILTIGGGKAGDALVGFWIRLPSSNGDQPVVTTTGIVVEPQELDPAGLELQRQILADDEVTMEELIQALDGWKACMEARGVEHVSYEVDRQGIAGMAYGSPTPTAGEAEDAACSASYLNKVAFERAP